MSPDNPSISRKTGDKFTVVYAATIAEHDLGHATASHVPATDTSKG